MGRSGGFPMHKITKLASASKTILAADSLQKFGDIESVLTFYYRHGGAEIREQSMTTPRISTIYPDSPVFREAQTSPMQTGMSQPTGSKPITTPIRSTMCKTADS